MKMSHDDLTYMVIVDSRQSIAVSEDKWHVLDLSQLSKWGIAATYEAYRQTYVFLCRRVQR